MPYDLSARIARLKRRGFKQCDIVPILQAEYGFEKMSEAMLSGYINEHRTGKVADNVLSACNEIVAKWEHEVK